MSAKTQAEPSLKKPGATADFEDDDVSMDSVIPPPDGEYGWVIAVASLLCNAVVDGTCATFGVLLPHLQDYYREGMAKTAFVGSLMPGMFLSSGPLASVLVNILGCRVVSMTGGVIVCIALLLSTCAPTTSILTLTFGFMGGIGLGMVYLPAMVMVGYYFESRRALASGIASSGAGVGMLVLAPSTAALLSHYHWQGTMIILAGITLQCVLFGSLMRPLVSRKSKTRTVHFEEPHIDQADRACQTHQEPLVSCNNYLVLSNSKLPTVQVGNHANGLSSSDHEVHRKIEKSATFHVNKPICKLKTDAITLSECELRISSKHDHHLLSEVRERDRHYSNSCHNLSHRTAHGHSEFLPSAAHKHKEPIHHMKPLLRKDIFYSGSLHNLPFCETHSYTTTSASVLPVENEDTRPSHCPRVSQSSLSTLSEMMDLGIAANPYFLIIALASVFIQTGYFIPIVFISDYADSIGVDAKHAAFLISIIGIFNTFGRAGAGAMATLPWINPLHLNNISLMVAGFSTMMCVLFCKDYGTLVIFASIYGLTIAPFVPLTTVFLVDYLGLDRLTNAFGLLSLVRGIASMVGPPIAGALLDATSSRQVVFMFAGGMISIAGLIHYMLPLVRYLQGRKKTFITDKTDEVQFVLQKVSNTPNQDTLM